MIIFTCILRNINIKLLLLLFGGKQGRENASVTGALAGYFEVSGCKLLEKSEKNWANKKVVK